MKTCKKLMAECVMVTYLLGLTACGDNLDFGIESTDMEEVYLSIEEEPLSEQWSLHSPDEIGNGEEVETSDEGLSDDENLNMDSVSVLISAAGDVTLGTHHEQDYGSSFTQVYDEAHSDGYFFSNVYEYFSEDDMTLVNLEGPLTDAEQMRENQTYVIKGKPEYTNILIEGSVEAVGFANNHRLDYLQEGSTDTTEALEKAGIVYAYDDVVGIYETKGIRIGYIAVNEVAWGAGVEKFLQEGITELREQEVDLILTSCHWGIEREFFPEEYQRQLGRKCIDWGADLVIGHHPHVLQGIEEYQGKFIVYSLANFCFGANRNPEDKDTMIFQQRFTFVDGVKQEDKDVRVIPCSVSSVTTRNDFCPTPAKGDEARRIVDRINEYSADFGVKFTEEGYLEE